MPLSALQRILIEIDATAETAHLLGRITIQRLALMQPDPRKYAAEVFDDISALLDRLDDTPPQGDYAEARRTAVRRNVESLAAEMARDLGLGSAGDAAP